MFLEFGRGRQGPQRVLGKLPHREITKFTGDLPRVEKKAEVGWRDAGRDFRALLLDIVGNQPIMLLCAELGVIAPDAERCSTEEPSIALRFLPSRSARRTVQPYRNRLAEAPQ